MNASAVCASCRQALRQQLRLSHQRRTPLSPSLKLRRSIATNRPCLATQPSAKPSPPTPKQPPTATEPPTPKPPSTAPKPPSPGKNLQLYIPPPSSNIDTIARGLRKLAPITTETYVAYGACERLMKECVRQADYNIPQAKEKGVEIPKSKDGEDLGVGEGWWYDTLGLPPTFNTWAQITFLHMYFLTCRFRCFPKTHAPSWHQHLLDHFFNTAEDRMIDYHKMDVRAIRQKYLKDLFVQWRGLTAGYDEGLAKGDAVLATAVWRNIFNADEGVDFRGVGEVVSYIRGVLKGLEEMEEIGITRGEVVFGDPETERDGVLVRSRMMDAPHIAPAKEKAKVKQ